MTDDALTRFQKLLRELFLAEAADLDFGIYRILNARRKEISDFIANRLPQIVQSAFLQAAASERQALEAERDRLAGLICENIGPDAFNALGELREEYQATTRGKAYHEVQAKLDALHVSDELMARVYSDLTSFFSRYYDDGDFIGQRRGGRKFTYTVPYNGEETLLYWATYDQYYVKTGERFPVYRFQADGVQVTVEIKSADVETNNNKGAKRYYVLADTHPVAYEAAKGVLTVSFAHRPLTEDEEKHYGKSEVSRPQDKLNEVAEAAILDFLTDGSLKLALQKPEKDGDPSRLRKRLNMFTKRNTSDFFVHKDLRGFLTRELDFFLKNEVLRLDELLTDVNADPTAHLRRARALQSVANGIIAFLAQAEDFQKRLFEKRKFVLHTQYALTLHHVPDAFLPEILANTAQLGEWREQMGLDELLTREGLFDVGLDAEFLHKHPALMVDTRHFSEDFTARLLGTIDDLDAATDGLCFNSENYQALRLMQATYRERVKCIYIDPPYNTGNDGFLYRDSFQHASWLSMMADRLLLAKTLLPDDGATFISIDDGEQAHLRALLDAVFGAENFVANIIWQKKYAPQNDAKWFSDDHDFLLCYAVNREVWHPKKLARTAEHNKTYSNPDTDARGDWMSGDYTTNKTADERPNLYYAIKHPETGEEIWPQRHAVWRYTCEQHKRNAADNRVWWGISGENKTPRFKRFLTEVGDIVPRTIWSYTDVSHTQDAVRELRDLLPGSPFPSPKPTRLIRRVAEVGASDILLDFFAGSGTTGHAIINLNRDAKGEADADGEGRKYILTEMGTYFDTVLLPRLKKAVFSETWKDGKPADNNGVRHLLKYHVLEQYEDTLNNVELQRVFEDGQATADFRDEYLLHYLLEAESVGSPSLLNVAAFASPFAYRLRVGQNGGFAETPVDLQATFHYLLGMRVRRLRTYHDGARQYRASAGEADSRRVVIVWRACADFAGDEAALARDRAFVTATVLPDLTVGWGTPDVTYINGAFSVPGAESIEPTFARQMWG